MEIREILNEKGSVIISISTDAAVAEAAGVMKEKNVGALMVKDGEPFDGIITERDIVYALGSGAGGVDGLKVSDLMVPSANLIVAEPDDQSDDVLAVMIQKGIRHMPIVEEGRIVGVISIRDLVRANVMKLNAQAHFLSDYIK